MRTEILCDQRPLAPHVSVDPSSGCCTRPLYIIRGAFVPEVRHGVHKTEDIIGDAQYTPPSLCETTLSPQASRISIIPTHAPFP